MHSRKLSFCLLVFAAAATLPRLARAERVTFRDDHTVLVADRPFFPLGLYYAGEAFADPSGRLLAETKTYGFNTLCYFNSYKTDTAQLDRAHQHGFKIWTRGYNGLAVDSDATAARVGEHVKANKDHPSLLFWEFEDEPLLNKVAADQARKGQAIVRQLDPNHPLLVVEWPASADRFSEWNDLGDIYGTDLYPIPRSKGYGSLPNKDVTQMRDYLAAIRAARGNRPTMLVLQAWSWDPLKFGREGYPTVAESRFMAYQAVVHGAKALFYYGQLHCTQPNSASALYSAATDPATQRAEFQKCLELNREFWQSHKSFFQELEKATPIFVLRDAPADQQVSVMPGTGNSPKSHIELITKQAKHPYVLAVNASPAASKEVFQLPAGVKAEQIHVLFEGRQLKVEGGQFRDDFAPYGVHAYSTSAALP